MTLIKAVAGYRVKQDMLRSETREGMWWLSRSTETAWFNKVEWDFVMSQTWVQISAYYLKAVYHWAENLISSVPNFIIY